MDDYTANIAAKKAREITGKYRDATKATKATKATEDLWTKLEKDCFSYLFDIKEGDAKEVENDLNNGNTKELSDKAKLNDVRIKDAKVTKEEEGKWVVTDGGKIYIVKKIENNGLKIHEQVLKLDVDAARKAFECDSNANLFIVNFKKKDKNKSGYIIYCILKESPSADNILSTSGNIRTQIKNKWDDLRKNIRTLTKEQATCFGRDIYEKLKLKRIKNLSISCNKTCGVWIYCMDELVYPIWEWLYTDFFWGDKYHIVRISESCKFEEVPEDLNFQISNVVYISNNCISRFIDKECFFELPSKNCISISSQKDLNKLENSNEVDLIHVVANIDEKEKRNDLYALCKSTMEKHKPKFIFLNLRMSDSSNSERDNLYKLKDLFIRSAEIWIDTSLIIPDIAVPCFVMPFYKEFKSNDDGTEAKNVAEAATKARKQINQQGEQNDGVFWRLTYIVKGNPCVKVTWAVR